MSSREGTIFDEPCLPKPRSGKPRPHFPKPLIKVEGIPRAPLNPGDFASLHERTYSLRPEWFEGFQLNASKMLAVNQIVHANWNLSHTTPTGFRIGVQFQRKCSDSVLKTPLIAFDVNPGTLTSNLFLLYRPVASICSEIRVQLQPQAQTVPVIDRISLQHTGTSTTTTLTCYNPTKESTRLTLDHLISYNDCLALGAELLYECFRKTSNAQIALAARYTRDKYSIAATGSKEAFDLSYWRKVNNLLQIGSSLACNHREGKAIGTIYYRMERPDCTVRGLFDSDWSVGFTYQRKLSQMPISAGLSLLFCIPKNTFQCGFKIDLDSNLQ
ncbi:mitochondrial import receptor subunit TOM40 homolog [Toxorhynchites rutilus septentrionalis]|uniref:mitochondrial import receptor subunit TOM40 homolog n=1 Tax=Toxorhynchites rutilus septentrionalis TaxID=329112 RepID=UPI0024789423|nr:mitochondrial import receptor subunit TOM40 homolog [Toxorhynchites rutilus septentrionalis]